MICWVSGSLSSLSPMLAVILADIDVNAALTALANLLRGFAGSAAILMFVIAGWSLLINGDDVNKAAKTRMWLISICGALFLIFGAATFGPEIIKAISGK